MNNVKNVHSVNNVSIANNVEIDMSIVSTIFFYCVPIFGTFVNMFTFSDRNKELTPAYLKLSKN